ncbi:MAG: sigma 54-interacting transcriptional regulator, partial [Fibrobacteres bacterium]|nr:sigma 54-interacting transcriptional regulator [Fibrobacterota bacterium]
EILTCSSNFNYDNTIQKPFRLSLKLVPGRIYDMSYVSLTEWPMRSKTPKIVEAMFFNDITEIANIEEDRAKLYEINEVLKSKNYYGFIGGNMSILKTIETIESMADFPASVLIDGPTGCGKEVLARAIHMRSNRRDKPFVKIDCASLPQTLLESELFGHEKGAFTGALTAFKGRFELAEGGTLFLDEIGNIDKSIQAKLLGFLEDRTITPLGSNRSIKINTRVIAATNAALETMIKNGEFREDLFFRLKVIHLHLPPLRERLDDIPILVDYFITQINERSGTNVKGIETFVLEALLSYSWPGNVRELYNTLLTMVIQKKTGMINERPVFSYAANNIRMTAIPERVRHERIIEYAKTKSYLTIRECTKFIPVSIHTLRKDFLKLTSQNKLAVEGQGPGILYRFNSID